MRENLEFLAAVQDIPSARGQAAHRRAASRSYHLDDRQKQLAGTHERRPEAAPRAGRRGDPQAGTAVPRRAHQRGRSRVAPRLLGQAVRARRRRHDDPGLHALHGRGRALPSPRDPRPRRAGRRRHARANSRGELAGRTLARARRSSRGARSSALLGQPRRAQRRADRQHPARADRRRRRRRRRAARRRCATPASQAEVEAGRTQPRGRVRRRDPRRASGRARRAA